MLIPSKPKIPGIMDYALPVSQLTISVLQVFFHYTLKVYRYTIIIVYNTGGCGITQRGVREECLEEGQAFLFLCQVFIRCISGGGMTLVTKDMMGGGFDHLLLEAKPVSCSLWESAA